MPTHELTADEARRIQLHSQGLLGRVAPAPVHGLRGDPDARRALAALRHLGAVQLDTISVLARSHELVAYARLGPVGRASVEHAYWGGTAAFEYWSHAACVLPVEDWPLYSFRRRAYRQRGRHWHHTPEDACADVLARLRAEGPLTVTGLGGAKKGGEWFDRTDQKIAAEFLLATGDVVCTRRVGWRRVYDLPERAIPAELRARDLDDTECVTTLVRRAARALGVATRADLADYVRVRGEDVDAVVEAAGLIPVTVAGWANGNGAGKGAAWAHPEVLAAPAPRGRHRTTLLSPFDSLVWDRKRTQRVFGFDHRLEAYVPRDKRVHGYFTMPLLAGGRLIGRADPAREGGALVVRKASLEPAAVSTPTRAAHAVAQLADALREAAAWVGCDTVRVERLDPPELAALLNTALQERGLS
ncbi:winged helix DNA-binding domain-containing protein [Actinoallomurus purpureus]|uniref:winged helix-turn-helix domain-containing protein n=1 Tax=Actinoallomurus purpureus TaxID=478114 RepID=UPI002093E352|nr:crosslink repair DNA glycosylase YcaQ family protein [Actinoallomurus purpureus]MCO6004878.1 winged helix DNA-binding domain-containing protein [Actinoallomurus purpureus]